VIIQRFKDAKLVSGRRLGTLGNTILVCNDLSDDFFPPRTCWIGLLTADALVRDKLVADSDVERREICQASLDDGHLTSVHGMHAALSHLTLALSGSAGVNTELDSWSHIIDVFLNVTRQMIRLASHRLGASLFMVVHMIISKQEALDLGDIGIELKPLHSLVSH
jgi:hypothetical protein